VIPPARPRRRRGLGPGARLAAAVAGGALLPLVLPPYPLLELCYVLVLATAGLGLNLLLGTTGLLSLGHAAFFGIAAYAGGFLFYAWDVQALEAYLAAGVLAAGALAAAVGALCVRATRIHFTIMTLAFGQMVHALFIAGLVFRLGGERGLGMFYVGSGGIYLPRLTVLGAEPAPERFVAVLYYVILAAFAGALTLLWRIGRSPFGLALRGIRDNDLRARFVGLPLARFRWRAFVVSGLVTGLAGALYGELDRQVTPEQLDWLFSARLVIATILGGTGHFLGPVAGAAALVLLQDLALRLTVHDGLVLGALLIAAILRLPGGLVGTASAVGRTSWMAARRPWA
jgi:branched-chain amino acid transport system permease protein